jgi:hypothetical protein
MSALAPLLQGFFTDRLIRQRQASPHTITGYRDTFRLLVTFAACCAALILRMLVTLILGMSWLREAPPGWAWRGWVVPGVSRAVLRVSR